MSWIQDHRRNPPQPADPAQLSEKQFVAAARDRWQKLGAELEGDVAEFNSQHASAGFSQNGVDQYQVSNADSGLQLTLTADFDNHTVRYEYSALNQRSAGVPEGGILSMRQNRWGRVEFYSADERLTSEETRQVLLETLLFPRQSAA